MYSDVPYVKLQGTDVPKVRDHFLVKQFLAVGVKIREIKLYLENRESLEVMIIFPYLFITVLTM